LALEVLTVAFLLVALAVILVSCEIFTNGIEWLGCRLGMAETATGSILAAIGTATPETVIPMIAIFLGSEVDGEEIGEGAILGAPFMLGTLAMFLGGVTVWYAARKGRRENVLLLHQGHAERDLHYFLIAYLVALGAGLLGLLMLDELRPVNYLGAAALLFAYVVYVRRTLRDECLISESSCPTLYLSRITKVSPTKGSMGLALISLQVAASLLGIVLGAKLFVDEIGVVSEALNVPAMILAFLIAPIATELPEKFNSIIWYWRGKDTLAFGNITGAMVFQSSIPVSVGLLFTSWYLEAINIASILIALAAAGWMYYSIKVHKRITSRTMLISGSLYVLYILMLVFSGAL
jgi:cation:H+ antiporter